MADREVKGIGGWLLAFLVAVGLFAAANLAIIVIGYFNMMALEARYGPLPLAISIEGWTLRALLVGVPLIILERLIWRRQWSSVRFAVVAIWVPLALVPLANLALGMFHFPDMPDQWFGLGRELSRNLFMGVAGSWYLLASRRVANTYPDRSREALADVFE